jgi:ribonuclease BN (tRNA processing enzyme)
VQVRVLGSRGEIEKSAPRHSKHSGVLIGRQILLDLGEEEFLHYQPCAIFITHLHADHAFFIRSKTGLASAIPVYVPEPCGKLDKLALIAASVQVNPYTITPFPVVHSQRVKSLAYLVSRKDKKILYTGDLVSIDPRYHPLLKDLDLVITDGSFVRKGGLAKKNKLSGRVFGHAGIPDLIDFFRFFTNNLLLVHFGSWFYKGIAAGRQKLEKLGKATGMRIWTGYDGLEIEVDEL